MTGATADDAEHSPARPGLSQDWPAGHDAWAQQVASTQFPDAQSLGVMQAPPFGIAVFVAVAEAVAVAVGVPVGVWVGVAVGVCVALLSQNPPPVFSTQKFRPEPHASAIPPEQSTSVLNRTMVPEQFVAHRVAHSPCVVITPWPQQPAEEHEPHGVQSQAQTQHTAWAGGTDVTLTVVTAAMHSTTDSSRLAHAVERGAGF